MKFIDAILWTLAVVCLAIAVGGASWLHFQARTHSPCGITSFSTTTGVTACPQEPAK